MTLRIFVSRDAGAIAVGADEVAMALEQVATKRGLTIEIVYVAAFIGLAFRSFVVMLASILPGIFPVVLAGTLLWVLDEGL